MGARAGLRSCRVARSNGAARSHCDAEVVRPAAEALEGQRSPAPTPGQEPALPDRGRRLVLRVHLMSAGRLATSPRGRCRRSRCSGSLRRRRRTAAHGGRQEEARRRVAARHPERSRRSSRISARMRSTSTQPARRDPPPRASPAAPVPPRPARARGDRSRARERDPLAARLSPFRLSTDLADEETARSRRRSTTTWRARSRCASRARVTRPCTASTATSASRAPLRRHSRRVAFEEHTITYCATCQTGGKVLKDRRLSRLLR